jgi:hypothetical protein
VRAGSLTAGAEEEEEEEEEVEEGGKEVDVIQ